MATEVLVQIKCNERDVPFETDQITHGTNCEIEDDTHPLGMDPVNQINPFLQCPIVRVKQCEVESRIT